MILIFIILNFYNSKTNIIEDIEIFGMWEDIIKKDKIENKKRNEYNIDESKEINIDIMSTIQNGINPYNKNKIYKKIAPGCKGNFILKSNKPLSFDNKLIIEEMYQKPQNLKFIIDNTSFSTIQELQPKITKILRKTNRVVIEWEWKYESGKDEQDTQEGENLKEYKIIIKVL